MYQVNGAFVLVVVSVPVLVALIPVLVRHRRAQMIRRRCCGSVR